MFKTAPHEARRPGLSGSVRASRFPTGSPRRARARSRLRRTRTFAGIRCEASGSRSASHRQHRTFLPPPEWNPLAVTTDPAAPTEVPAGPWEVAVLREPVSDAERGCARSALDPSSRRGRAAAPAKWSCSRRIRPASLGRLPLDRMRAHHRRLGRPLRSARRTRRRGLRVPVREPRRRGGRDAASSTRTDLTRIRSCRPSPRASSSSEGVPRCARARPARGSARA